MIVCRSAMRRSLSVGALYAIQFPHADSLQGRTVSDMSEKHKIYVELLLFSAYDDVIERRPDSNDYQTDSSELSMDHENSD